MSRLPKSPLQWSIILFLIIGVVYFAVSFSGKESGINPDVIYGENDTTIPLGEGQTVVEADRNTNLYKHSILGFSFEYLKEYNISSFGNYFDSVGETILIQKAGEIDGLQVLVKPFNEDIALTVARIKKDLPNLNITNAVERLVGGKVQAVVFSSNNNLSIGETFEAWFIYRNQLYQVSSPETSRELFDKIINTWQWAQ